MCCRHRLLIISLLASCSGSLVYAMEGWDREPLKGHFPDLDRCEKYTEKYTKIELTPEDKKAGCESAYKGTFKVTKGHIERIFYFDNNRKLIKCLSKDQKQDQKPKDDTSQKPKQAEFHAVSLYSSPLKMLAAVVGIGLAFVIIKKISDNKKTTA